MPSAVGAYLRRLKPSLVVHAAGRVGGIEANMREPVAFLTENWDMGQNSCMARPRRRRHAADQSRQFVHVPEGQRAAAAEDDILSGPLEPTNEAYAIAKSAVQRLCDYIRAETPAFQYKTLIPCNLFGRYDTFDPRRSHLAAAVIHKLHRAKVEGRDHGRYLGRRHRAPRVSLRRRSRRRDPCRDRALRQLAAADECRRRCRSYGQRVLPPRRRGRRLHGRVRPRSGQPVGMKRKLMDVSRATAWGWTAKTPLKEGLARVYKYYVAEVAH